MKSIKMNLSDPLQLLTMREAGELLRIGPSAMTKRIERGSFPAVKLSDGALRVRRVDMERFIAERIINPELLPEKEIEV